MWRRQCAEEAGRGASGVGVIHSSGGRRDGVGKAFFKHLTGAECALPCLRVIAARPLLCTGVITLHFTPACHSGEIDSVYEQHGGL